MERNSLLKGALIATLLLSFTVLLTGGYWIFKNMAPRPVKVVDKGGNVLTTSAQIEGGQAVFQKYGLMDYGSVLGYGSYLGPDPLRFCCIPCGTSSNRRAGARSGCVSLAGA